MVQNVAQLPRAITSIPSMLAVLLWESKYVLGRFYIAARRRLAVPAEFLGVEKLKRIRFSLKTKDKAVALKKAKAAQARYYALCTARLSFGEAMSFDDIPRIAKSYGVTYQPQKQLTDLQLIERVEMIGDQPIEAAKFLTG